MSARTLTKPDASGIYGIADDKVTTEVVVALDSLYVGSPANVGVGGVQSTIAVFGEAPSYGNYDYSSRFISYCQPSTSYTTYCQIDNCKGTQQRQLVTQFNADGSSQTYKTVGASGFSVDTSLSSLPATAGVSTLTSGVKQINSAPCNASSHIFLQPTGASGSATGVLQVTSQGTSSFTVSALDLSGAVVTGASTPFNWWILNPYFY